MKRPKEWPTRKELYWPARWGRRSAFCLPNCFSLPDGSGPTVKIGREVSGDGGRWLPHVVEIRSGCYVPAVCQTAPNVQVVGFEPFWSDVHYAMHQAERMAAVAAE